MKHFNLLKSLGGSFNLRIFAYLSAAILIVAVLLNVVIYDLHKDELVRQVKENGRLFTALLAGSVRVGVISESEYYLRGPVETSLSMPHILRVIIYAADGRVLFSNNRPGDEVMADFSGEKERGLLQPYIEYPDSYVFNEPVMASLQFPTSDAMFFEPGLDTGNEVVGHVTVQISKDILKEGRKTLLREALIGLLIFLVMALPLTYLIAKEATAPLKKMMIRIKSILPQNSRTDDLSMLETTYYNLLGKLEHTFEEINDLRENLEEKVKDRTIELTKANRELEKALQELKMAQMQLVQSEKMSSLGQVAAGVAHEVNNAVNFISGSLWPLKRALNTLDKTLAEQGLPRGGSLSTQLSVPVERLLDNMQAGITRITSIVRDLSTFARPEMASFAPVDINHELESTLSFIEPDYKSHVAFIRDFQPLPAVTCHAGKIGQVFINILLNAVYAIEEKGEVTITTRRLGEDAVMVAIRDTGEGIPAHILPKIYDPFFTTREVGQGTGLGLGICYSIVKKHGGDIVVESTVGEGTTVIITLPLRAPEDDL